MKPTLLTIALALVLPTALASAQDTDNRFMREFTESFSGFRPQYFNTGGGAPRYFCGVPSLSEKDTDVMLLRIQPTMPFQYFANLPTNCQDGI